MLTPEERNQLGLELTLMAVNYNQDFPKERARIFIDALEKFVPATLGEYLQGLNNYAMNRNNRSFPSPALLRTYIFPEPDGREVATELVRKIDRAIMKHGANWSTGYFHEFGNYWEANGKTFANFKEAVVEELGHIGWHVICSRGGWANVCYSSNEMDEGQYVAQMRDQIQSTISLSKQGVNIAKIEMPKKETLPSNVISLMKPKDIK